VRFQCDEVAKIVAQTMNNYLMFNKLLKCWFHHFLTILVLLLLLFTGQFIRREQVHTGMLGRGKKALERNISMSYRLKKARLVHNKVSGRWLL
jgi:hypothetical protein